MGRFAEPIQDVAEYGPGGCVATWRNSASHCVIRTKCKENDISGYEIKMLCVDSGGEKTRHVFGPGSFAPEETFDTLVLCNECLADDTGDYQEATGQKQPKLSDQVAMLRENVEGLKDSMEEAAVMVAKLNKKVFGAKKATKANKTDSNASTTIADAKNASAPAAAPAAAPANSLVHVTRRPRRTTRPWHAQRPSSRSMHQNRRPRTVASGPSSMATAMAAAVAHRRSSESDEQEDGAEADSNAEESGEALEDASGEVNQGESTAKEASAADDTTDAEGSTADEADGGNAEEGSASGEDADGEAQEVDTEDAGDSGEADSTSVEEQGAGEGSEENEGAGSEGDASSDAETADADSGSSSNNEDSGGDSDGSDGDGDQEKDESAEEYLDEASAGQDDDA